MSRCCAVTSGPMSQPRVPSPVTSLPIRSLIFAISSSAIGLDGDERRDRHAPLPRRAEAGVDRGVGRQVEVGVGQHEHVVLRAAEGLDPLAVRRAGLVDVLRDRGRADERHRLDVGVREQRVDGLLVAVDDADTPSGSPASFQSPRSRARPTGPSRDGLITTALPQAMATGTNHIGTMAGKLNGEITATTPSGWRIE